VMLLRAGVLALLAMTLSACGSEDDRATSSSGKNTAPPTTSVKTQVRGAVLAGPTCPVERAEKPCPPAPVAARIEVEVSSGERVAHTRTNAEGRYRLALAPGEYTLVVRTAAGGPFCAPVTVKVAADRAVQANISCDTGIR
jgi:hypothetical protein